MQHNILLLEDDESCASGNFVRTFDSSCNEFVYKKNVSRNDNINGMMNY